MKVITGCNAEQPSELTAQEVALLKSFRMMDDRSRLLVSDITHDWAKRLSRCMQPTLQLLIGGAA